ncbi:hypothetical protein J0K78_07020 [Halobacillus sp. GSS1]|uniref:hypothetical protein n=1 Tax=Halobacillus sp. GSS1 TaxID=2815919 RepID=UPI001A902DB1|nr:hypothetical protein [Halobacillus sp. GSS1]MBN9654010.1 hypothetical protein [Halobacillus sp. GSS1]
MTNTGNPQMQGSGNQSKNIHDFCRHNLYQMVQIEMTDGQTHTGLLHSYDHNQMNLIMPTGQQGQQGQQGQNRDVNQEDSRLFFPFFGPFGLFGFPFWGIRRWWPYYYPYSYWW